MSDIATIQTSVPAKTMQAADVALLVTAGKWLPRLSLQTSSTKAVKRGEFPANHWAFIPSKNNLIDLGERPNAMALEFRPMALDARDEKKLLNHFVLSSPEFQNCLAHCDDKDTKLHAGLQFLMYIQGNGFCTWFAQSKSAKTMAAMLIKSMRQFITLGSKLAENTAYVWQAPIFTKTDMTFDLPPESVINTEAEKFLNPPEPSVATEPDAESRER